VAEPVAATLTEPKFREEVLALNPALALTLWLLSELQPAKKIRIDPNENPFLTNRILPPGLGSAGRAGCE